LERYWVIDFRLYDPAGDGKTKLDHMHDMLALLEHRKVLFGTVLMDTWYATTKMMLTIADMGKTYYCPIKANRQVDDSNGKSPYKAASELTWTKEEQEKGKTVKLKKFPQDTKLKLFRVVLSTEKTELIVSNGLSIESTEHAQEESAIRWHIEQYHREIKNLTGVDECQCRIQRSQRNNICCALRVWLCLNEVACKTKQTIYQVKYGMLDAYMRQQLRAPSVAFC
jgi:hypothetical protein